MQHGHAFPDLLQVERLVRVGPIQSDLARDIDPPEVQQVEEMIRIRSWLDALQKMHICRSAELKPADKEGAVFTDLSEGGMLTIIAVRPLMLVLVVRNCLKRLFQDNVHVFHTRVLPGMGSF